jgi:hypothetical protein
MTTVSRVVRSSPHRDTVATWELIVDLLAKGKESESRRELLSVSGIAAAMIAERAPHDAAIVVTCDGPRTRIYCLYDEDAIDGSDAKEDAFGHDPLQGTWTVSLPCPKADLEWVERALKAKSKRITARDMSSSLGESQSASKYASAGLAIDTEAFLKS